MQKVTEKPSSLMASWPSCGRWRSDDPPEEVRDRLAELLPEDTRHTIGAEQGLERLEDPIALPSRRELFDRHDEWRLVDDPDGAVD